MSDIEYSVITSDVVKSFDCSCIPLGTNCAPVVAGVILFCYERNFMRSLSDDKQTDIIDAFNTTSGYLDDIVNIMSNIPFRAPT